MTTQEIANFIKTQLQMGSTKAEVERILTLNRVTPQDISAAFNMAMTDTSPVQATPSPIQPPPPPQPMTSPVKPPMADHGVNFPPPTMALNSIDSIAPTPAQPPAPQAPIAPRSIPINATFKSTPPPPPLRPIPQAPVPQPQGGGAGKWFFLLFILIILGLGGTGAYAYITKPAWATPLLNLIPLSIDNTVVETIEELPPPEVIEVDPTADWLIYTSEYGFEFKYPSNLTVSTSSKEVTLIDTAAGTSSTSTKPIIFDLAAKGFLLQDLNYQSIFDQISSTLRFIEPTASSATTTTSTPTSTQPLPPAVDLPSLFLPEN